MKLRFVVGSSLFCAFALAAVAPALAADPSVDSSSTTSSNGSSTGVGNAGSFGIGSGTADSETRATAAATSDGQNGSHNTTNSDYHGVTTTTTTSDYHGLEANDSHALTATGSNNDFSTHASDSHDISIAFYGPMSIQELTASVANNVVRLSDAVDTGDITTGAVSPNTGSGVFAGVQTVSINTGLSSSNQAITSISAAGAVSFTH